MPLNYVCFIFRVSKYLQSPKYFARYCARLQGTTVNKQLPALMGFYQVGREANKYIKYATVSGGFKCYEEK